MTGKVCVTDGNGSNIQVSTLDARYTSGELVGINKGKKCSEATKKKIGTANSKIQIGTGNSQYGTMWVYNPKTNESKKIRKEDFSTSELGGWIKGRKINK